VRGAVFAQEGTPTAGEAIDTFISYPFPLAGAAPTPHIIDIGGTPPAGCSGGSSADPKADPGHLCIFLSQVTNVTTASPKTFPLPANGRFGVDFRINALLGNAWTSAGGTWAMTAP
jgi:hypothetical protein